MKTLFSSTRAGLLLTLLLISGLIVSGQTPAQDIADDPDVPLITGKEWTNAKRDSKLAFLLGIANALEIEQAFQADDPPGDRESLVPVIVRGLSGSTLTQVMEDLDRWYAEHEDQLDRPVLETIWWELALPNS